MQGSLTVDGATAGRQRADDRLFPGDGNRALKSVRTPVSVQVAMFDDAPQMGSGQVRHAAIVWTYVLQRHPERKGGMVILGI
jgi:hypothetical protein